MREIVMTGGAVAIWHDIEPAGLAEFYAWHGEEHMPERVSIPGFRRGRRFLAEEADLRFFNLYETESPDVVRSAAYRERLDNPTPRTLSAVRHFRNVARSLCSVVADISAAERRHVEGGTVATLRLDAPADAEPRLLAALHGQILPRLVREPGVARVLLLAADRDASGYVNAEQRARGAPNLVPPVVVVAEGWGEERDFAAAVRRHLGPGALGGLGLADEGALGFYRHQATVARD